MTTCLQHWTEKFAPDMQWGQEFGRQYQIQLRENWHAGRFTFALATSLCSQTHHNPTGFQRHCKGPIGIAAFVSIVGGERAFTRLSDSGWISHDNTCSCSTANKILFPELARGHQEQYPLLLRHWQCGTFCLQVRLPSCLICATLHTSGLGSPQS